MGRRGGAPAALGSHAAPAAAARKPPNQKQPLQPASLTCSAPSCVHKPQLLDQALQSQQTAVRVSAIETLSSEQDGWRIRLGKASCWRHPFTPLLPEGVLTRQFTGAPAAATTDYDQSAEPLHASLCLHFGVVDSVFPATLRETSRIVFRAGCVYEPTAIPSSSNTAATVTAQQQAEAEAATLRHPAPNAPIATVLSADQLWQAYAPSSTGSNSPQTLPKWGLFGIPSKTERLPAPVTEQPCTVATPECSTEASLGDESKVPSRKGGSSACAEWAQARQPDERGTVQTLEPSTAALVFYCPASPASAAGASATPRGSLSALSVSCANSGSSGTGRLHSGAAVAEEGGVWRALVQVEGCLEKAEASVALLGFVAAKAAVELAAERLLLQAAERSRAKGGLEAQKQQNDQRAREMLMRLCELLPLQSLPAAPALRKSCLRLLQWRVLGALLSLLDLVSISFPHSHTQQDSSSKLPSGDQALLVALLQHHVSTVKRAAEPESLFCYFQLLQAPPAASAEQQQTADFRGSLCSFHTGQQEDYKYTAKDGPYLLELLLHAFDKGGNKHELPQPRWQRQLPRTCCWEAGDAHRRIHGSHVDLCTPFGCDSPPSAALELLGMGSPVECLSRSSLCIGDRTEYIDCGALGCPQRR
ncbi:hypothetical protein cyc_07133 [Cyclospora cayetanensis]|uniref:Uncharacterized protein n=1 Tax=Cyclospora cayetanensis TaxID=88456 RepID=A0A1D3D4P6_9EIME|nr:hypothetical protein cyc_07133 [Cyclospora cayetanensis]